VLYEVKITIMTIALFSDIHANLPALEAFFEDVDRRKPDAMYCLGDLVGYNVWPNEVIEAIRNRRIPTIAGNYDFGIGRTSDDCGCAYKSVQEKADGAISITYTNRAIKAGERSYLRTLPAHIRLEYQLSDHMMLNVLFVHGSPRRINEYLFEDREEKSLLRIMKDSDADVMCFGHTHKPYHRILADGDRYRHAINIGSVGKPKDKDPRGCYVLLNLDEQSSISDSSAMNVEFVRFTYDIDKSATAIENSPLPNGYAHMLRNGT
jgi:predicted phosphodiesterase